MIMTLIGAGSGKPPTNASNRKGKHPAHSPFHRTKSATTNAGPSAENPAPKVGRKKMTKGGSTSHTFASGGAGPPSLTPPAAGTRARSSGKSLLCLCVDKIAKPVDVDSNNQPSQQQSQTSRTAPPSGPVSYSVGSGLQLTGTQVFFSMLRNS
jgi:hypothetical protein